LVTLPGFSLPCHGTESVYLVQCFPDGFGAKIQGLFAFRVFGGSATADNQNIGLNGVHYIAYKLLSGA
jgi:hypothetical protein